MYFSIIVPVFNRPDEVEELLESLIKTTYNEPFEVVIVEDGSVEKCNLVVEKYREHLNILYFFKRNTGPGDSRNFGMQKANGDYFIIFDSDCLIPPHYLETVKRCLQTDFADCYGGPDQADTSFTDIQKAVDFAMTAVMTTGGIRGASEQINKFQPRSFNMGLSREAFTKSTGFGNIHPGEDPDLSIRLWKMGFETKLYKQAFVYHKRRISWRKFYEQVHKFGLVRPILNKWHPEYSKITYLFPSIFIIGLLIALLMAAAEYFVPIIFYIFYFIMLFINAMVKSRSLKISVLSVYATVLQFYGYGTGFLKSIFKINVLRQQPQKAFPNLFFKKYE